MIKSGRLRDKHVGDMRTTLVDVTPLGGERKRPPAALSQIFHSFGDAQGIFKLDAQISQRAVDGEIEVRAVAPIAREFEAGANTPNQFRQQRTFLADQAAAVPGFAFWFDGGKLDSGHE